MRQFKQFHNYRGRQSFLFFVQINGWSLSPQKSWNVLERLILNSSDQLNRDTDINANDTSTQLVKRLRH